MNSTHPNITRQYHVLAAMNNKRRKNETIRVYSSSVLGSSYQPRLNIKKYVIVSILPRKEFYVHSFVQPRTRNVLVVFGPVPLTQIGALRIWFSAISFWSYAQYWATSCRRIQMTLVLQMTADVCFYYEFFIVDWYHHHWYSYIQ